MTTGESDGHRERTAAAMQSTADRLEQAEATLHRSAEASPDDGTRKRLHSLAGQVTAEAKAIEARAGRLSAET